MAGFLSTSSLQNASSYCMRFCSLPLHLKASHFLFFLKYNTQHWPASNFWWAKARSGNSSCFADDYWWLLLHVPHAFHSYSNPANLMCFCNPAFHFEIKRKKKNKQKTLNKQTRKTLLPRFNFSSTFTATEEATGVHLRRPYSLSKNFLALGWSFIRPTSMLVKIKFVCRTKWLE